MAPQTCAGAPDDFEREADCPRCGSYMEHVTCDGCGGEGVNGHDCGEDCCMCADPEENVPCDFCGGNGGWFLCGARCPEKKQETA